MLLKGMEFDTTHFITDVSGKYPRLWALNGAHPVTVNRYHYGIRQRIEKQPDPPQRKRRHEESAKFGTVRKKTKDGPSTKKSRPPHLTHYKLSAIIHGHHTRRVPAVQIDERDRPLAPLYKELRTQKEEHRKISEHQRSEQFLLLLHCSIRVNKSFSIKYLRLKVENELRLCWVLLKEFRTTISPAAVE
ncbi:hypothetical protein ACS0TY_010055 [Phlomoides rotata]